MLSNVATRDQETTLRRRIPAFSVGLAALLIAVLFPIFPEHVPASEGQVAKETLRSPISTTFPSEVLTQQQQEEAKAATEPVLRYSEDTARAQSTALTNVLSRIGQVRDDTG